MEFPNNPIKLLAVIASSRHYVEYNRYKITTGDPLTAVPVASMTVLPIYYYVESTNEVKQHLRDQLFHGLQKQFWDSMHYLYDDAKITYLQLISAAQKPESEQEDHKGEGIHVISIQVEGKGDIVILSKQFVQLWLAVQKPQNSTVSNPQQLGSEKDSIRKKDKINNSHGKNHANCERSDHKGIRCSVWGVGALSSQISKYSFKWKVGQ